MVVLIHETDFGASLILKMACLFVLWAFSGGMTGQERNSDKENTESAVTVSNRGSATILVGPEHVSAGAVRYPRRKSMGEKGAEVEFSLLPAIESVHGRGPPPLLSHLYKNSARQIALDKAAKPGDWVTPPAANR
ncbi:hypothetical protein BPTFM16_01994 [Altererythrobacter insulae]|nr:hypothetical protein BPTFM16_01994 [Altererythrobacter insulae]